MGINYQEGYAEGLQDEAEPKPGQSIRAFLVEGIAPLSDACEHAFWLDSGVYDAEESAAKAEWYRGWVDGFKSLWAARLKEEEMYRRR